MKFVKRKATTSKSKYTVSNFEDLKRAFLDDVVSIITMEEIKPELVLNWDQTGLKITPLLTVTEHLALHLEIIVVAFFQPIDFIYLLQAKCAFLGTTSFRQCHQSN
jgi:hypothetical protein